MEQNELIAMKMLDARVCSAGKYDEALEWIRKNYPAGTENNWQKHEDGAFAPIPCADDKTRTHYMFIC